MTANRFEITDRDLSDVSAELDHGRIYLAISGGYALGCASSLMAPDDARRLGEALMAMADAARADG